jgi:Sulfotransferase domain
MISNFVLIIGAMKSGTTTLYDYLRQHPQIASGPDKEPGFFAFEEKWALGLEWYESQFDYDPRRHRYALEASTDYTKHPFCKDVVERLKASAPRQFKLIYIMRHPLRRVESHARHVASTRREVGRCISPRKTHGLDAGISPVSMAISRYAYQIDIFMEYYDKGDLLLLTLEQLAYEADAALHKVTKFLDIDPLTSAKESLKSNVADFELSSHPVRQSLYPLWQTLNSITTLRGIVKAVVPQAVRSNIYRAAEMWARPDGRFTLNADETIALTAALTPDLRRLRDRYGIDVTKEWGINL